jgi:hypothetical protein
MPATKEPLFECQECGKKFYTVKAAERASFSERGCPGCGGSDIDIYVGKKGRSIGRFGGSIIRIPQEKKNVGKGAGIREANARDKKAGWAKKRDY